MSSQEDRIFTDEPITVKPLLELRSKLHGKAAAVLRDDGCNMSIGQKSFSKGIETCARFEVEESVLTIHRRE